MIISISIIFVVIPISPLTRPRQAPPFSTPLSLLHHTTLLSSEAFCGYVKVVVCHCRLISQGRMNCICAMTSPQEKPKKHKTLSLLIVFQTCTTLQTLHHLSTQWHYGRIIHSRHHHHCNHHFAFPPSLHWTASHFLECFSHFIVRSIFLRSLSSWLLCKCLRSQHHRRCIWRVCDCITS